MKISWAAAEDPLIHDVDFHARKGVVHPPPLSRPGVLIKWGALRRGIRQL